MRDAFFYAICFIAALWFTSLLMGCTTEGTYRLTPDMTRDEVIKIMRAPSSAEWDGRVEGLYFAETQNRTEFCVKLYRGRVLVYGPYACGYVKEQK